VPAFFVTKGKLAAILRPRSVRDFVRIFGAELLRMALGFLASILIARGLGPQGYGSYAVLMATVAILMTLSDFGLTPAAVRFLAQTGDVPSEQRRVMAVYAVLKGGAVAAILVTVLVAAPWLSGPALSRPDLDTLLRLAALLLLSSALMSFVMTLFQGMRRFREYSSLQPLNPAATLLAIALLAVWGRLNVASVILVSVAAPFVPFLVGVIIARRRNIPLPGLPDFDLSGHWRTLVRFSKWLWISSLFAIVASRLDLLLLNRFSQPEQVGAYALALGLATKLAVVNGSLITVLLPTVSAFRSRGEFTRFARTNVRRSLMLATLLLLAGLPLAQPLILGIYGESYAASTGIFRVLLFVVAVELAATPFVLFAYPLDLPKALAAGEMVKTALLGVAGVLLVPVFGPTGMAVAKLIAVVAGTSFVLVRVFVRLRGSIVGG
jgi:O-antigen/teichoic acid export membrane protein